MSTAYRVPTLQDLCRKAGLPVSGKKADLECRIARFIETAPLEAVQAWYDATGAAEFTYGVYRDLPVQQLRDGMRTHNGYCSDRVAEVRTEPEKAPRGDWPYNYASPRGSVGPAAFFVRYSLHQSRVAYSVTDTVAVEVRDIPGLHLPF
jgi:hypothetical protein